MKMTTVSGATSRTRGASSSPDMPPIMMSLMTRSNLAARRRPSAASAVPTAVQS